MKKRIALTVIFGAAVVGTWPVYSLIQQGRRDAEYRTAIAPFRRDLHIGIPEAEVKHYLDTRHIEYHSVRYGGSEGPTYEIKVGEEDSLICDWDVNIALEFGPTDVLKDVHIRKIGTCL